LPAASKAHQVPSRKNFVVAGHAGCYNHALANIAFKAGASVEFITTTAELTVGTDNQGTDGHGYSVEGIHFVVAADLPGLTYEHFAELTEQARALCSISKILRIPITLYASRITNATTAG
jgi:osmotically inducible protein OsmC